MQPKKRRRPFRSAMFGAGLSLFAVHFSSAYGAAVRSERHAAMHDVDEGMASFYSKKLAGRRTANGSRFDEHALTAAHRSLPFGTHVKVTNLRNHKSVVVEVTDRGPFIRGRIIDLSREAARQLGFANRGTARVRIEKVTPAVAVALGVPLLASTSPLTSMFTAGSVNHRMLTDE